MPLARSPSPEPGSSAVGDARWPPARASRWRLARCPGRCPALAELVNRILPPRRHIGVTTADRKADENRVEDQDAEVERLQGKVTRRERDAQRLQRKNNRLQRQVDRLKEQVERLKRQLDEARRAGRRQAAPFAKDRPQGRGGHSGRRAGAAYGRHGCRPRPARRRGRSSVPGFVALVVELHTEMGVPLAKVAHLLRTTFGLQVTPGGLAHVLHRAARAAGPAYAELCEQVRNAPVVTPDETGWRVGGVRHWLWAFVTPDTTVYAICPGRGFDDAATVLGTDYVGVLVRDGWAPYRCYDGLHQTCLNHLLQRCKQLREDHPGSPWAGEVKAVLRAGLDLRDRCNAEELSEHGMATARGRLNARLARLIDAPPPLDDAERFAAHLATEFPAVFLFLWDPSVDATNWRAEQAIRPAVVIRKVCGGNRTRHGADTQQVLASVVRTARQRNLDLPPVVATMLRAPVRIVPDLFGLPPPSG